MKNNSRSCILAILLLLTPIIQACSLWPEKITDPNRNDASKPKIDQDYNTGLFGGGGVSTHAGFVGKEFVAGSSDIPLASGLALISDDGNIGFDSTSGSIILIKYRINVDPKNVQNFYIKTLPQMGWLQASGSNSLLEVLSFKRDNQKLEIEFYNKNGVDFATFLIESIAE